MNGYRMALWSRSCPIMTMPLSGKDRRAMTVNGAFSHKSGDTIESWQRARPFIVRTVDMLQSTETLAGEYATLASARNAARRLSRSTEYDMARIYYRSALLMLDRCGTYLDGRKLR